RCVLNKMVFLAFPAKYLTLTDADSVRFSLVPRFVVANPAWILAAATYLFYFIGIAMEAVRWRVPGVPCSLITHGAYNVDVVPDQGRAMKVRRRENVFRVAKDLEVAFAVKDNDIVVDAKVRIVIVVMFAGDL